MTDAGDIPNLIDHVAPVGRLLGRGAADGARISPVGPSSPADQDATSLRAHEAVCAERYGNILRLLEATTRRVARLEVLVVIVAGSVISGMGGIIFTLALKLSAR